MPPRKRQSKSAAKRTTEAAIAAGPVPPGPPLIFTQHPGVTLVPSEVDPTGQYKTIVDKTVLYELAETHASYEQMARILIVDVSVLRCAEYEDIIERARANKVNQLLSAQFKSAIEDRNPTMQIWLGKNYAEQKDVSRTELTGPDGKPVQMQEGPRLLAVMPVNGRDLSLARQRAVPALPAGKPGGLDAADEVKQADTAVTAPVASDDGR